MKKLLFLLFMLISPAIFAGFPEGKNGYDLEKLEKSFRLPCDEKKVLLLNSLNSGGSSNRFIYSHVVISVVP